MLETSQDDAMDPARDRLPAASFEPGTPNAPRTFLPTNGDASMTQAFHSRRRFAGACSLTLLGVGVWPTMAADTAATPASGARSAAALSAADAKFIKAAAEGGLFEIAVGKLAAEKATNAEVKSFANMLIEQHGAANDKLKKVADAHGITLPTVVPSDKQTKIDRLSRLSGDAFDRQFVEMVGLADHRHDIAEFEKESRSGKSEDVRNFAAETLPTLKAHLETAQKLRSSRGRKAASAA
jgi:putative membrane protein